MIIHVIVLLSLCMCGEGAVLWECKFEKVFRHGRKEGNFILIAPLSSVLIQCRCPVRPRTGSPLIRTIHQILIKFKEKERFP